MKKLLLFLCVCGPCGAACSISITSPANNATVSGPIALTATYTQSNCPSAIRGEWKINGAPLPGNGTYEYSYSLPVCASGTCTLAYTTPNGYGNYNASFLWDGNWPLTVQLSDAAGTVLATSPSVNMVVQDYGFGSCSFTSPNLAVTQSGTVNLTMHCPFSGMTGAWANGNYNLYVDGLEITGGAHLETGYPDITLGLDTTSLEDGQHQVWGAVYSSTGVNGSGNTAPSPFAGVFGTLTTCNSVACGAGSTANRELRANYDTAYLWLGANPAVSLFERMVHTDNSEIATNATFVSGTPSVATVGSCTNVASCTVTAVAQGVSIITATDPVSGKTNTTRVVVLAGTPIFPHFGYDGSICTAYNSGNCAGGKSEIVRGMFDGGSNIIPDHSLAPAMFANSFNVFEFPLWPTSGLYLSVSSWESNAFDPNWGYVNLALSAGFRSFMGRCEGMDQEGKTLQSTSDSNFATKWAYAMSKAGGKLLSCINGDEIALPVIGSFSGTMGQIGSPSGPSQIVVTAGSPTNLATVTWTNVKNMVYGVDITGADNACFLADGPNGNGTVVPFSGDLPGPFTFHTTCPVGTYAPSGGTVTEAHAVFNPYNDLCNYSNNPTKVCQNYGPFNNTQLLYNSGLDWGVQYIQVSGGAGVATIIIPGMDTSGGTVQLDIASATNTCLNGTNMTMTRTGVGTYTFQTNGCANGFYGSVGAAETTATLHPHCTGCTITGTLNQAVPNTIFKNIVTNLHASTPPVAIDFPWAAGATSTLYKMTAPISDYANVFWTRAGPENQGEQYGFPQGHPHRVWLLSLEQDWWTNAQPGIDLTKPWITITQSTGPWYARGGNYYTLGTTSGAQFTTTVANNSTVGARVTVTGSSCNGYYTVTAAGNPFTVSGSPGCTGSGGSVSIAPNTHYYTPPQDKLKKAGARGIEIPPIMWDCIILGCAGFRTYNYGTSGGFFDYPAASLSQAYLAVFGTVPPNSPNNENNNTGSTYIVSDNPSADERWKAMGVTHALIKGLEPQIIQPLCSAPDFGPRFHTGAKCGTAGKLVIAINDSEVPMTVNFPASLWSLYNNGTAAITRYQEIKAAYVNVTNLAAGTTSDTFTADGGEIDIWWFPAGSTPLAQPATIGFNPASVGATKTALRYSYLCNPATFASNLDQQATRTVFTSATSVSLFKAPGPICYDYLYLDNANNPIGARSNVQVLQ